MRSHFETDLAVFRLFGNKYRGPHSEKAIFWFFKIAESEREGSKGQRTGRTFNPFCPEFQNVDSTPGWLTDHF